MSDGWKALVEQEEAIPVVCACSALGWMLYATGFLIVSRKSHGALRKPDKANYGMGVSNR